ncbi:hypothetical protein [uncultured Leifsonia sp.]|uniref:hypothetical protein n=1 Tax=uncultured Leifsonia sp. TaxID=340359 RepID=UPI0025F7861D|nr:hypothetical protein [uncultured Leifsonia sp.]
MSAAETDPVASPGAPPAAVPRQRRTADDIAFGVADLAEEMQRLPTLEEVRRFTAAASRRDVAVLIRFFDGLTAGLQQ